MNNNEKTIMIEQVNEFKCFRVLIDGTHIINFQILHYDDLAHYVAGVVKAYSTIGIDSHVKFAYVEDIFRERMISMIAKLW